MKIRLNKKRLDQTTEYTISVRVGNKKKSSTFFYFGFDNTHVYLCQTEYLANKLYGLATIESALQKIKSLSVIINPNEKKLK